MFKEDGNVLHFQNAKGEFRSLWRPLLFRYSQHGIDCVLGSHDVYLGLNPY